MEAMWINFKCSKSKFVVRPYLGGVNGISGEVSGGDMGSLLRRINAHMSQQDYVVLPEQRWLDGISTSPGIVKQFVATEMVTPPKPKRKLYRKEKSHDTSNDSSDSENGIITPIGASIEWQVTGKDAVGGVQLQIIPTYDVKNMSASSTKNVCQVHYGSYTSLETFSHSITEESTYYEVLDSPEDQGLQVGEYIHVKDMKARQESRPKVIADLLDESPLSLTPEDILELRLMIREGEQLTFKIYLPGHPQPSATLSVRTEDSSSLKYLSR